VAGVCEQENCCPIVAPARRVSDRLNEFLQGVTLAEIAAPAPAHAGSAPVAIRV
jgi:DNA-binding IscR family transcriptional regulator